MADLRQAVEAELENIDAVISCLPPAATLGRLSELELAGVSTFLHNFYNGVENILRQILKARDVPQPSGSSWHRDLLNLCMQQAILSSSTAKELGPYLGFRHFFAHGYATDLDPAKLEILVQDIRRVYGMFKTDVASTIR